MNRFLLGLAASAALVLGGCADGLVPDNSVSPAAGWSADPNSEIPPSTAPGMGTASPRY